MTRSWMVGCLALMATAVFGCEGDPQLVQPAARGERGEACQARNDCASGLACVGGTCSKNDFAITVTAKHCDRIDCSVDTDCCGDRPLEAPARCANRESICETPSLPGCQTFLTCTDDSACGTGTCDVGYCSTTGDTCSSATDCVDTCTAGFCSLSGYACTGPLDCLSAQSCVSRNCDCDNPLYDPFAAICSDADCTDICNLRCNDERCVVDNSCEMDLDCYAYGLQHCAAGTCVECMTATDCDGDNEVCTDGECIEPCIVNEQCPLFHQCQGGDCVETGCTSDRECVLAFSTEGSAQDARLSKCLPSDEDPTIKVCKVPCENDAACPAEFEVCNQGFCTFIGCDTNEECRSFLGLEEQQITDLRPYISTAECRQ